MENTNMDQQDDSRQNDSDEMQESGGMRSWIQDNLRIIASVLIVVAIAAGVYSYSKRTAAPEEENRIGMITSEESANQEEITLDSEESSVSDIRLKEGISDQPVQKEDSISSAAASQETEQSFIETAGQGDGLTHLARRSLANYLEKNSDQSLTAEHKIYIEDYLRKKVGYNKGLKVGNSVEFSKSLIQDAIQQSKTLNEKQLQNLHQYAVRVPSLS